MDKLEKRTNKRDGEFYQRIGTLEKDHARYGVYRAVALAILIPLLTYFLPRIVKALGHISNP